MKKQLAFFGMIFLLISLTSASLCKGYDDYYHDCDPYSPSNHNHYSNYYDEVQYVEYSYERESYNSYNQYYSDYSSDYSSREGYYRNSFSDHESIFRPSEYVWSRYPDYGELDDHYYSSPNYHSNPTFNQRSLYEDIFFYR